MIWKYTCSLVLTISLSVVSRGQYDLSISWNEYEEGDITDNDPFLGSFTVKNEGDTPIPANDTIWYGYGIEGEIYDLDLNLDLVSGEILDVDLMPGEEISVFNTFTWPLWGSGDTINVCAVIFGVGYVSYTGDLFTGDEDVTNNKSCVQAIIPEYTVGIDNDNADSEFSIYQSGKELFLINPTELSASTQVMIYSLDGKVVQSYELIMSPGKNVFNLGFCPKGLYFIDLQFGKEQRVLKKVALP